MSIHDHSTQDNCSECPMTAHCCHAAEPAESDLKGWAFAWSSIGVFFVPVILGIAGALIGHGSETRRFLFGSAGLFLGMLLSMTTYKIFSHSSKKDMDS